MRGVFDILPYIFFLIFLFLNIFLAIDIFAINIQIISASRFITEKWSFFLFLQLGIKVIIEITWVDFGQIIVYVHLIK